MSSNFEKLSLKELKSNLDKIEEDRHELSIKLFNLDIEEQKLNKEEDRILRRIEELKQEFLDDKASITE